MDEWKDFKGYNPSRTISMEEVTGTLLREKESLRDKAMLRYAENFESESASIEEKVEAVIWEESEEVSLVKVIWALKHLNTNRRQFNNKQKNYLTELFLLGEKTGRKEDASKVSKKMRKARN